MTVISISVAETRQRLVLGLPSLCGHMHFQLLRTGSKLFEISSNIISQGDPIVLMGKLMVLEA